MRSSSAFSVNPNLRTPPAGPGRSVSGGYPPQGYGPPPPQGGHPYGNNQQPPDIGFSAPHDPSGADRRRRMQRPEGPAGRGGPDPRGGRVASAHHLGGAQSPRPPRGDSRPAPSSSSGTSSPSQAMQQPPQKAPPASPLPGKGPKTFEEMGVPAQKNDSDCVRQPPAPGAVQLDIIC